MTSPRAGGDLAFDVAAAAIPGLPAGLSKLGSAAAQCTFKTGHYASRLQSAGVNVSRAESSVADVVRGMRGNMFINADVVGCITVDGKLLEYRARLLPNGVVNVGTIFPVVGRP